MEDKPDKKAEEPEVAYNKKKITFFKSFEESEEADHAFYRNLSPEERFDIFYTLMHRFFDFKGTLRGSKIIIDK